MTLDDCLAHLRWLDSDAPSRVWQRASYAMWRDDRRPVRWLAKQLRIDPADPRAWFAIHGFVPLRIEDRWHIAASVPAPDPFDAYSRPSDDVVLVDPEKNAASMLGAVGADLVLPTPQPQSIFVHTDPMRWLREWADERVIFFETRRNAIAGGRVVPRFCGEPPAALAIGDLKEVPWSKLYATTVRADFEHAAAIKKAIFRAAHIPAVEAA